MVKTINIRLKIEVVCALILSISLLTTVSSPAGLLPEDQLKFDYTPAEVTAGTAAVLAAGYSVFAQEDPGYADLLLEKARQLYLFADTYRSGSGYTAANGFYTSFSGFWDELAWGATWLHLATGESAYLNQAKSAISTAQSAVYWAHSWDNVSNGTNLLLAEELNVPFTEVLAKGTQYFGEFGFEMMAVVPYAYWLHQQGRLERTVACEDTRCLYYFSENHRELSRSRSYVPITEYPVGEVGKRRFDKVTFPVRLDTSRWAPPPYGEHFWDERFRWSRPTCIICNKMSEENYLGSPRVNSIETDLLLELVGRLRTRYQVVYDRPRSVDIVNDHQRVGETGDIEALQNRHPDVLTIQQLHIRHPEFSFNELQLRVFAGCRRFVSVTGGSAYLASWFGGTNIVYARAGWELECGAFESWFSMFSNARVIAVSSLEQLVAAVDREFLGEALPEQPPSNS